MPWCPICQIEYREGYTVCSDCNVALIDDPPLVDKTEVTGYSDMTLLASLSVKEAIMLETLLKDNGIQVFKRHKMAGHYMTIITGYSVLGVDIFVPKQQLPAAKELLVYTTEMADDEPVIIIDNEEKFDEPIEDANINSYQWFKFRKKVRKVFLAFIAILTIIGIILSIFQAVGHEIFANL